MVALSIVRHTDSPDPFSAALHSSSLEFSDVKASEDRLLADSQHGGRGFERHPTLRRLGRLQTLDIRRSDANPPWGARRDLYAFERSRVDPTHDRSAIYIKQLSGLLGRVDVRLTQPGPGGTGGDLVAEAKAGDA